MEQKEWLLVWIRSLSIDVSDKTLSLIRCFELLKSLKYATPDRAFPSGSEIGHFYFVHMFGRYDSWVLQLFVDFFYPAVFEDNGKKKATRVSPVTKKGTGRGIIRVRRFSRKESTEEAKRMPIRMLKYDILFIRITKRSRACGSDQFYQGRKVER